MTQYIFLYSDFEFLTDVLYDYQENDLYKQGFYISTLSTGDVLLVLEVYDL